MQSLPPDLPEGIYRERFVLLSRHATTRNAACMPHYAPCRIAYSMAFRRNDTRDWRIARVRTVFSRSITYLCIGFLRIHEEHARYQRQSFPRKVLGLRPRDLRPCLDRCLFVRSSLRGRSDSDFHPRFDESDDRFLPSVYRRDTAGHRGQTLSGNSRAIVEQGAAEPRVTHLVGCDRVESSPRRSASTIGTYTDREGAIARRHRGSHCDRALSIGPTIWRCWHTRGTSSCS